MSGRTISPNFDKVASVVEKFMTNVGLWDEKLAVEIPSTCENYGGLLLFSSPAFSDPRWFKAGAEFWQLICSLFKGDRVAVKGRIKDNCYRSPQAKLIYGDSPVASFIDNRIKYAWNIEKTMFSRGNVTERHRIAKLDCSDQVIVDLFAGIGYFTIPYLVHSKAKHVHACEWNPDAIQSLRRNLEANKVADRCTIYEGDNRLVCPKRVANKVNLGLIPTAECSWETACQALLPTGGDLLVHQNIESNINRSEPAKTCTTCEELSSHALPSRNTTVPVVCLKKESNRFISVTNELQITWKWPEWYNFSLHLSHVLLDYLESFHGGVWHVFVPRVHKVKSYAPHIDHVVLEVKCQPCE